MDTNVTLPLISVVVPVYNVEEYLPRCLRSILAQTHLRLEVIAVDDGSTDGSAGICDVFAARDRRLQAVHFTQNRGQSAARNEGIRRARGEYITFVDSDDCIEPDMLEKMYQDLTENEADVCICGIDGPGPAGGDAGVWSGRDALGCMTRGVPFGSEAGGKLYRARDVKACPFPEDVFCYEDYLFLYQLLKSARRVSYLPDRLYHYVQREDSLFVSGFTERKYRSALTVHDRVCRDAAVSLPDQLPEFRRTALNGFRYLAVLAVRRGTENGDALGCLKQLQQSIRQYLGWRELALLGRKKAAAVLLLCLSRTAFWGAAVLRDRLPKRAGK